MSWRGSTGGLKCTRGRAGVEGVAKVVGISGVAQLGTATRKEVLLMVLIVVWIGVAAATTVKAPSPFWCRATESAGIPSDLHLRSRSHR